MGVSAVKKKATSPSVAPPDATAATNGIPRPKQKPSKKEPRESWSVPELAHLFNMSVQSAKRRIILLTVFRKQRMRERAEVARARRAIERCIREGHTLEKGHQQ